MRIQPRFRELIIEQDADGYRYSIEPFLLASFAPLFPGARVLDVGTGCGVISLLLLTREPNLSVTAVEIQPRLSQLALKNVEQNDFTDRIQVVFGDFADFSRPQEKASFDLVLSNPPYRKVNTGRTNPNQEKAIARHELHLNLKCLAERSTSLLLPGGRIVLAYPPERMEEVVRELREHRLYPHRMRFIHGHGGAEAKIFLIEAIKDVPGDLTVEAPLFVYQGNGSYTVEMEKIYGSFNCADRPDHVGQERGRPLPG